MNSKTEMINTLAPALRVLLGRGGVCPLVRWIGDGAKADVKLFVTDIDQLRAALGDAPPQSVQIDGLGVFEVRPFPGRPGGRVFGKVVVITGAAQGFGYEIAQHLAAQGAAVVLADINEAGVRKAAEQLQKEYGPDIALPVGMDVTNLDSIKAAVHEAVKIFGGFDCFISNAGVLKAGSVKTQSPKDFAFVTAVNYTGYFLCVQAATPVLAAGHAADPRYRSDIIQINSKSGLVGSNRNGAYAGSKFGGIGLTQSFALELIEDGIKVNSICPGNFFDGPLWSDPENGLFVQYLRTGKVPGAKTVEDVRRAYEAKVPMGRGCTTPDVMKAIYYLIGQEYETGQALPVTGGQVMLH